VKAGTYYQYVSSAADTVSLPANVGLYGGFTGTETDRSQANPYSHRTILDGHPDALSALQVLHVVSDLDVSGALIDGFVIQGGNASGGGNPEDQVGGGVLLYAFNNSNASLTVSRCEVNGNRANTGGAIGMIWGNPALTLQECDIHDNAATANGGGLSCTGLSCTLNDTDFHSNHADGSGGGVFSGSVLLGDLTAFAENSAGSEGGGLAVEGAPAGGSLTNLVFIDNFAGSEGGGLFELVGGAGLTLVSAVFLGNQASVGGAVATVDAFTCINCTVTRNRATSSGHGLAWFGSNAPQLFNTIVWANPDSSSTAGIVPATWSSIVTSHSDLAGFGGSDSTSFDADPLFTSLPELFDFTVAASADASSVVVANGSLYQQNDLLELQGDGVGRAVTGISSNTVSFAPALAAPAPANLSVRNWGVVGPGDLDLDLRPGSLCIDAADPNVAPALDATGAPRNGAPDIGAYESP
jgi:hypothetical protein